MEDAQKFVDMLRIKLRHQDCGKTLAAIYVIWLCGVMEQLGQLGITSGGKILAPEGIDQWHEIDKHRLELMDPRYLGHAIAAFVEEAAVGDIQLQLAQVLALYYTESGRELLQKQALDRLITKS